MLNLLSVYALYAVGQEEEVTAGRTGQAGVSAPCNAGSTAIGSDTESVSTPITVLEMTESVSSAWVSTGNHLSCA